MNKPSLKLSLIAILCLVVNVVFAQQKKQASLVGKVNIQSYLQAAPGLPLTIGEAANRTYGGDLVQGNSKYLDDFYQPFHEKMEALKKQYESVYGNKVQEFAEQKGETGFRKMAEDEANKSGIVKQMGGVNNVMKMDKAEAEKKARQAAVDYGSSINGGVFTPEQMQRMMTDKEYAKQMSEKLNNMRQQEKEAMAMQQVAKKQSQPKTPKQVQEEQKQFEQRMQEKYEVKNSMDFQHYVSGLQQKITKLTTDFGTKEAAIKNAKGKHVELSQQYGKEFAAIPEKSYGEAGRHKDAEMWQALDVKYTRLHRERAESEMNQISGLLEKLRSGYKQVIAEYVDFLDKNKGRINDSMDDLFKGTNTEIMLAGFESSLVGLADEIAKTSKRETKEAANYFRQEWLTVNKR